MSINNNFPWGGRIFAPPQAQNIRNQGHRNPSFYSIPSFPPPHSPLVNPHTFSTAAARALPSEEEAKTSRVCRSKLQRAETFQPQLPQTLPSSLPCSSLTLYSKYSDQKPLDVICSSIEQAQQELRLKIYILDSDAIIEALKRQVVNGKKLCLYYQFLPDGVTFPQTGSCHLTRFDHRGGAIQHKKHLSIDTDTTILSSGNFTDSSLQNDINITLKIICPQLYQCIRNDQAGSFLLSDQQTVTYYPLKRNAYNGMPIIVTALNQAKTSIKVALLTLANQEVLKALAAAKKRGVSVEIVVDRGKRSSTVQALRSGDPSVQQLPVQIWEGACTLHCKIGIIDDSTLITGSANWTKRGLESNLEDLIIVTPISSQNLATLRVLWQQISSLTSPLSLDDDCLKTESEQIQCAEAIERFNTRFAACKITSDTKRSSSKHKTSSPNSLNKT